MTAEIAQTPEARRAAALASIKLREDGIRNNAIKQGRALERKDQEAARNELLATHDAELRGAQAAYEHAKHTTHKDGFAHGFHKAGWVLGVPLFLTGIVAGAAIALGLAVGYTDIAFGHAQQATQQGALVGAAAANQREPAPPQYGDGTEEASP